MVKESNIKYSNVTQGATKYVLRKLRGEVYQSELF